MLSRNNLLRLPALLAIGLFAFGQTTVAEENIVPALSDTDNDKDDTEKEEKEDSRTHQHGRSTTTVTESAALRLDSNTAFTFAPVAQTAETEAVIVRGFYIDVPDYP